MRPRSDCIVRFPSRLLIAPRMRRCAGLRVPGGTMLGGAGRPGGGRWRGAARLQVIGSAAGPWFPWAVAGLAALAALAAPAGLEAGDRYRAGRCFLELRYVSGR